MGISKLTIKMMVDPVARNKAEKQEVNAPVIFVDRYPATPPAKKSHGSRP
ncbi:hypothetical protein ENKO_16130 [Enterobacter kobei]|uniref:Uncharacterized protein n=1 Tax=Enterobacter kobei TaxID=208224 RepID=A0AA86MBF5_9ENTR|nr:hypothetical protein ENKO_16130 [Enterobacter kobei]